MVRYVSPLTGQWVELGDLEGTTPCTDGVLPKERLRLVDAPPEWHAETVGRLVESEGVALFWSEAVSELVAFCRGEQERSQVPAGVVSFTAEELVTILASRGPRPVPWKLLVEAKRQGAVIASPEGEGN